MERRQLLLRVAAFGVVAAGAAIFVWPALPRAQRLRLHLGAGSTRVVEVQARLATVARTDGWDRQSSFRFPSGAPPSFEWAFEQENGRVRLELDLVAPNSTAAGKWEILLGGGEATVELGDVMRRLA